MKKPKLTQETNDSCFESQPKELQLKKETFFSKYGIQLIYVVSMLICISYGIGVMFCK